MTRKRPPADPAELDPLAGALMSDDEASESLREVARRDPVPGAPLTVRDAWGREIEEVEPGAWRAAGLADPETGLPPNCPVVPLGKSEDQYFFLNTLGGIESIKSTSSGKGPIGSIFAGREGYLEWAWPRWRIVKGAKVGVAGWEADDARQALYAGCAYVGVFDDADRVRGRGAWRDVDGSLIYHAGNRVLFRGRWLPPGRHGDWVFPARPPMPRPAPKVPPGGAYGPATDLLDLLESWTWRRPTTDPRLLLGWLAMSMLSGALDWRAAVYITGERGSGKSSLQDVLGHVLGRALFKSVNTSGPGIYQKLRHDCTPVWIDELEAQSETNINKVVAIVELIRTASSGGTINRGSQDGASREYQCRSPFICSSINIPPMRQQDTSRFCVLQLQPFPDLPEGEEPRDLAFDAGSLERIGRELLARMIAGWPRWPVVLKAFRHALIKAGHDPRGADQFGALIAAEHLARSDTEPTAAELDFWARELAPAVRSETTSRMEDWRECLQHLLDVTPEHLKHRTGTHTSLGAVLFYELKRPQGAVDDAIKAVAGCGLALSWPKGEAETWENARLFIPQSHPEVRKLFTGTSWAGLGGATGVWHTTLQRAPSDVAYAGACAKGLDKKRWGTFVRLAAAFPDAPEGDQEA